MDEMRIVSKFTNGILSKVLEKIIRKKLGCNMNVQLNNIRATITDGLTHVHLDVDAELTQEELIKILSLNME